jgi:exodeoxyribonuclease-3
MRVASFNIRNGGVDDGDAARLGEIAEIIRQVKPDVLAIEEANGFGADGAARLHALEAATGMRGHLCHTASGFDIALLVRPELSIARRGSFHRGFRHGAAYADVALEGGGSVRVIGAHLAPESGTQRLAEVHRLLRRVGIRSNVVVMGDLNSLDQASGSEAQVLRLAEENRGRYLLPDGSAIDTRVIDALEAAGLHDLIDRAHPGEHAPTAPTRHGGGDEFHHMRLDRIFGSPSVASKVTAGGVWHRTPADTASDHYLVWADIALTPVRRAFALRRRGQDVRPMSPELV